MTTRRHPMAAGGPARRLTVLAVEPMFGGLRQHSLQQMIANSRHRWHLVKLPARRPERRLQVSGTWFSEVLAAHPPHVAENGRMKRVRADVAVVGDMLNLTELRRLWPPLAKLPIAVRYHEPAPADNRSQSVRANALRAADEVWVLGPTGRATLLSEAAQLAAVSPFSEATVIDKARLVPPAIGLPTDAAAKRLRARSRIAIDATAPIASSVQRGIERIATRGEKFTLVPIGPHGNWPAEAHAEPVDADDLDAVAHALWSCRSFIGGGSGAAFDTLTVRALLAGCWVMLPDTANNRALLSDFRHSSCLHAGEPHRIYSWLLTVLHQGVSDGGESEQQAILDEFDPPKAATRMDDHLCRLANRVGS